MNKKSIVCFFVAFVALGGCSHDDGQLSVQPLPSKQTRCHANYIIDGAGTTCHLGECGNYETDLNNHSCPTDIPFCILDNDGHFYCGTKCPDGMHEVSNATEFASMCEKDTEKCSLVDCLAADGHEGWSKAECNEDGSCKVVECRNGYTLHDNNCLSYLQCCGDACNDCTGTTGWKYGECKEDKCVAELCDAGYHLLMHDDGSVDCVLDIVTPCGENDLCPAGQVCNNETGTCVCDEGYTFCNDGCYNINYSEQHCGVCNRACDDIANGYNFCDDGTCQIHCLDGYVPTDDNKSCVKDDGSCKNGESRCSHEFDEIEHQSYMTILECNNGNWETKKKCGGSGSGGRSCSSTSCSVQCKTGYIQNADASGCEPLTGKCTDGEKRCSLQENRDVNYLQCVNGQWKATQTCESAHGYSASCNIDTGCKVKCHIGYVPSPNGTKCEFDSKATCTAGEQRCSGSEFHECKDGHWVISADCSNQHFSPGSSGVTFGCREDKGCFAECASNHTLCNNTCVDTRIDSNNCGTCGKSCGTGKCVNSVCQ